MKEEPVNKKTSAAGQNKDKERAAGPQNSVASLPLPPVILEHTDKAERYRRVLHPHDYLSAAPTPAVGSKFLCLSQFKGQLPPGKEEGGEEASSGPR